VQSEKTLITNSNKITKDQIKSIIKNQNNYFSSGNTKTYEFRISQLKIIKEMLINNQDEIIKMIQLDLKRPTFEIYTADYMVLIKEINFIIKNLKKWMKNKKIKKPLLFFKSTTYVESLPYGVSLLVSPWNYPINLIIKPLLYNIAAGNTAILKPSEISVNSSKLMADMISKYFDPKYIAVILGGPDIAQELLKNKFDFIMYTGSTNIGKIYSENAAKNFTPIILEMGGKSPAVIDKSAKLDKIINQIILGSFFNCAQTCIAIDYILINKDIKSIFISKLIEKLEIAYSKNPQTSKDYGRIINLHHYNRIKNLYDEVSANKIHGGTFDQDDLYIAPTIIDEPDLNSQIMKEEIFGPLLPILSFSNDKEIYDIINNNPDPLALYIFSEDKKFINSLKENIQCGDININDVLQHVAIPGMKFGGVKSSGLGGYGGQFGFDQFSHKRSVFHRSTFFINNLAQPPYTTIKERLLKLFYR